MNPPPDEKHFLMPSSFKSRDSVSEFDFKEAREFSLASFFMPTLKRPVYSVAGTSDSWLEYPLRPHKGAK